MVEGVRKDAVALAVFRRFLQGLGHVGGLVQSHAGRLYFVAPLGSSVVWALLVLWLVAFVGVLIMCREVISLHGLSGLQVALSRLQC